MVIAVDNGSIVSPCSCTTVEDAGNDKSSALHNCFIRTQLSIATYKDILS